jgi:hypothetical protein
MFGNFLSRFRPSVAPTPLEAAPKAARPPRPKAEKSAWACKNTMDVPAPTFIVHAFTRSEARAEIKRRIGRRKHERLPSGFRIARVAE